ncbi:MAG: T9SS type A sorting domain-containing protein [Flavobacteriales bacterium]|jgi:hypothetical protein|nr:T9SS type A sorting domain-containing protein [Flavobacteriales bacterium]
MTKLNSLIFLLLLCFVAQAQQLVSITPLSSHSLNIVQAYLGGYGWNYSNMNLNPVRSYKVTYNTTDVHGNPTVASGAVYIPTLTNCTYAPIIAYEHGTEFDRNNVPSKNKYVGQGIYFSTTGYITVMPDYLGLGDNPGIHLYQHAETEATATLDLIRAVRTYLDTTSTPSVKDNGQVFITGYSQGGHAAMATLKYIEDNAQENDFDVMACAPLSGAFDQTGAQFDLIFDGDSNYYASPFLPYILGSYQEAYANLYQNYNEIYDASHATSIQNYLTSGTNDFSQWLGMLGTNYYGFMQDSVLQNILADANRDSHPINIALRANNLYDWAPNNPVRMLYCGSDSMVAPENSTNTLDTMLALGATDVQALNLNQSGDHNTCFIPATTYALNWFDSLAYKCSNYAGVIALNNLDITLYPNPANHQLTIEGLKKQSYSIVIQNALGQTFPVQHLSSNQLSIEHLPNGVYFVVIRDEEKTLFKRLKFIKN